MGAVNTRPVPTNLFRWPRTRDLISQQKGIFAYLWFHPDQTACGCYLIGVDSTAADLSMTSSSLGDALREFQRRKLIDYDEETGEILIPDWFRWYFPNSPAARGAVEAAIKRILSTDLRTKTKNLYESIAEGRKGKEKEKDSSKEEYGGLPRGWWSSERGTLRAGEILGIKARPGESIEEFRARIRNELEKAA